METGCSASLLDQMKSSQARKEPEKTKTNPKCMECGQSFNPIVVGLFDSTILVGGGAKKPPLPT